MKCPSCLSIMKCISAINPIPNQPGRNRMDLHCHYGIKSHCRYSHMGVITEDPKCWECHEYSFEFKYQEESYLIKGQDIAVDPQRQTWNRKPKTEFHKERHMEQFLTFSTIANYHFTDWQKLIELPYFIPLSTDNDMHEKAWELFHRLRKMVAFS